MASQALRVPADATLPSADLRATTQEQTQVPDLATRLITLATEDKRLTREASALPGEAAPRTAVLVARADHGRRLREVVRTAGWPTCEAVGDDASTAALLILLGTRSQFLLGLCRPLIAEAVTKESTPAIHLAYVDDLLAVLRGYQQTYGTQVDPVSLRPFPIKEPRSVDARRATVGLPPLAVSLERILTVEERSP
ncbi:DUF6624 domain-containing protein [Streptomyces sp. NPDC001296]